MRIDISKISKSYKKKAVLRDISFSGVSGEMTGIIGVNGSGKSTLLSILANVQRGGGDFRIDGRSVFEDKTLHSKAVGYVPQTTPLINELTARDNLLFWYTRRELERETDKGIVKLLGVDRFMGVTVKKMSGGMKKRLSLCCAMANKPSVLLLDEPTSALDIVCRKTIMSYLDGYRKAGGIVIIATHNEEELRECDHLYILKNGTLKPYTFNSDISELIGELSDE